MNNKEVNTKKIFAITILALFLFSFSIEFVLGATTEESAMEKEGLLNTKSLDETLSDGFGKDNPIESWFSSWESGTNFSTNIAKYLFWALVSMIIFTVGKTIPGLDAMFKRNPITDRIPILGIAFSIIIGFLSMAYITPAEVYAMMIGYSALGYLFGGFLPLIIVGFFTINMATTSNSKNAHSNLTRRMIAIIMWIGFALFATIKAMGAPEGSRVISWIIALASIAMAFSTGPLFRKIGREMRKEKINTFKSKIQLQAAKRDAEAADAESS